MASSINSGATALESALMHLQQGELDAAEAICRGMLSQHADVADAWHILGIVHAQRNDYVAADECMAKAIALGPDNAGALLNRGNVCKALKKYDDALSSYNKVLLLDAANAQACNNIGTVLAELGRLDEAIVSYEKALRIVADYVEARFNLGLAFAASARHAEALTCFETVLAQQPTHDGALTSGGVARAALGEHAGALAYLRQAVALAPGDVVALSNLGVVLSAVNRHDEALAIFDRVVALTPQSADAHNYRGGVLALMQRHEEAVHAYSRALDIAPNHLDALAHRGGSLRELGQHERAARDFSKLAALEPGYPFAAGNALHARLQCCDWDGVAAGRRQVAALVRAGKPAALPFSYLVIADAGSEQLACARRFIALKHPPRTDVLPHRVHPRHDRIRVAYVSGDFRRHPLAYLMAGMLECHDRSRFDITAWSFGADKDDEMRLRLRKAVGQLRDVHHVSDLDVAKMLREHEVDIAVDLMGFTGSARTSVFSYRAAPIQLSYLGYPGTLGAEYMDYIIADHTVLPVADESHYVEKVVRLPFAYQVNDSRREVSPRTPGRVEAGLPASGFVFCCFNNNYKISPEIFEVWMQLLVAVKGSVLWLFAENPAASRHLRAAAEARGVNADRLVFASRAPLADHLARQRLADLFLDTLPYNAHTTASDALWVGLPVLTCIGNSFQGRVAASLLRAAGVPELITENLNDYKSLALKLAMEPGVLRDLKAKLTRTRNTCPLFDTERTTRHMESAYATMVERYQNGMAPDSFSVLEHR